MAHGQLLHSRRRHLTENIHYAQLIGIPVNLTFPGGFLIPWLILLLVQGKGNARPAGHIHSAIPGTVYFKNIAHLIFHGKFIVLFHYPYLLSAHICSPAFILPR